MGHYELADFDRGIIPVTVHANSKISARILEERLNSDSHKNVQLDAAIFLVDKENKINWLYSVDHDPLKRRFFHFDDHSKYLGGPFGKA